MRPASLWSIDSPHWALIATQSAKYVHTYDCCAGIQFDGSLSPFDRFCEAETAISERGSERSFAKAWRRADVHEPAVYGRARDADKFGGPGCGGRVRVRHRRTRIGTVVAR